MNPVIKVKIEIEFPGVPLAEVDKLINEFKARWGGTGTVTAPMLTATPSRDSAAPPSVNPDVETVIADATTRVRALLRTLAESSPGQLTVADLMDKLELPDTRSVAGLRSVMKRSQARLTRQGKLTAPLKMFEEYWDGAHMSYAMTAEQATAVLATLDKLSS